MDASGLVPRIPPSYLMGMKNWMDPPQRSQPADALPEAQVAPEAAKLVAKKERLAAEGAMKPRRALPISERVPPGQSVVRGEAPVLDLGTRPHIDPRDWRLEIAGLVARPLTLDLAGLNALGEVDIPLDIHCVTGWSALDQQFKGVPLARVLEQAGPLAEATHAVLKSQDGYTTNLPLADLMRPDVLVATSWGGKPLTREHGGPVRLVVPHLYFWKSAKWLKGIRLIAGDHPGYWEVRGYHRRGDPWKEERFGR